MLHTIFHVVQMLLASYNLVILSESWTCLCREG